MNGMLILQFLVLTTIVSGVLIFFLHRTLVASTDGAVTRLNKETEDVRAKQSELNQKIKEANEELARRKKEAEALVAKMTTDAEEAAKAEREKMLQKAREESDEIIKKAQGSKQEIRRVIEKEMEAKAVDYTITILNSVLSEKARGALEQQLVVDFIENLQKVDMRLVSPEINTAEMVTAHEIDPGSRQRLAQLLKEKLNRDIQVVSVIDPKIISGVILRFGSLNLDGSLQNFIKETGLHLKEKIEKEEEAPTH